MSGWKRVTLEEAQQAQGPVLHRASGFFVQDVPVVIDEYIEPEDVQETMFDADDD